MSTFFKIWFRSKYATNSRDLERINNSLNRWSRENSEQLKWNKEDVIAVFSRVRGNKIFERLTVKDSNTPHSCDYRYIINFIDNNFQYFSKIYILILKKIYYFDNLFDSIYYNDEAVFSWQPIILLSAIRLNDDEDEVSRKLRIVSKYIDILIVSRFANGKKFGSADIKDFIKLTIDIRDMNFTTLKNYLVEKIDSSKLQILSKEQENKTGIKNLRLNRYTKRGIKYILARISEFVEKGSTEKKGTFIHWFMDKNDVEHIVEDNYERYTEDYYGEDNFNSYRNKIGALVLIKSGTNKSIQDKPFIEKKYFYTSSNFFASSLCELPYVHETGFKDFINQHNFDFKPYDKFGIQEIDERTELVAKIADYIWNRDRIIEIE